MATKAKMKARTKIVKNNKQKEADSFNYLG
jgi:hypothetical protein